MVVLAALFLLGSSCGADEGGSGPGGGVSDAFADSRTTDDVGRDDGTVRDATDGLGAGADSGTQDGAPSDDGASELRDPRRDDYEIVLFDGDVGETDHLDRRLCEGSLTPDELENKTDIDCELEGADFAPEDVPPPTDEIVVYTYNLERGIHLDEQIGFLRSDADAPRPDILLVNELDRGCSRSGRRNIARDLAEALEMAYVFAVEFVELPRGAGAGGRIEETCEHGNAILSRYPLANVDAIRHRSQVSWYLPPEQRQEGGEPRLGGRVAVVADVVLDDTVVHLYSIHFESHPADAEQRDDQALEIAEHAIARPFSAIVGGDTNAPAYWIDLASGQSNDTTVAPFLARGFVDAHAELSYDDRQTRGPVVIDLLFGTSDFFADPGVCDAARCGDLSDHVPVWASVELDELAR